MSNYLLPPTNEPSKLPESGLPLPSQHPQPEQDKQPQQLSSPNGKKKLSFKFLGAVVVIVDVLIVIVIYLVASR